MLLEQIAKKYDTHHADPATRERSLAAFSADLNSVRAKHPTISVLDGGEATVNGEKYGWVVHSIL